MLLVAFQQMATCNIDITHLGSDRHSNLNPNKKEQLTTRTRTEIQKQLCSKW